MGDVLRRKMNSDKLRFAIVGCGAITEANHLPVLRGLPGAETTLLVDVNPERAQSLASRFGVANVTDDYKQVSKYADAAIIAVPHHLHAPIAVSLLNDGVHVLVEKPLAMTVAECDSILRAAERHHCTLAVGLMRRFYPSALFVKQLLLEGVLGAIRGFDVREGGIYGWPVASDFFFRKESGGGVLLDTGAHALDLILWWLGGWREIEYFDNARGGVESDCEVHLELECGAKGVIELSRTRNLSNRYLIQGEKGTILYTLKEVTYFLGNRSGSRRFSWPSQETNKLQLEDFISAIKNSSSPVVSGVEGKLSVSLIEACQARRKPLDEPWLGYDNQQVLQGFKAL